MNYGDIFDKALNRLLSIRGFHYQYFFEYLETWWSCWALRHLSAEHMQRGIVALQLSSWIFKQVEDLSTHFIIAAHTWRLAFSLRRDATDFNMQGEAGFSLSFQLCFWNAGAEKLAFDGCPIAWVIRLAHLWHCIFLSVRLGILALAITQNFG